MRITIIGAGVVGQATGKGFARLGHEVTFVDLNPEVLDSLSEFRTVMQAPGLQDIYFICVPEDEVTEAIEGLIPRKIGTTLIVIRSTVPPGTTRTLGYKYSSHICHNPEFLREATAEYDFLNFDGIVLGMCCGGHEAILRSIYTPFRRPIYFTTSEVSELAKLAVNGYLACQISYWNQLRLLADALDINSHEVGMLASSVDPRISAYGARMHGKPYSGKCLPKDLAQLQSICSSSMNTALLRGIKSINDEYIARVG